MPENRVYLNIAGLNITIYGKDTCAKEALRLPYSRFMAENIAKTDLSIQVRADVKFDRAPGGSIFDTEYSWMLHSLNGGYLYQDRLLYKDYAPYVRKALIKKDFSKARVFCSKKALREKGLLNWVLDLPLGQFLMASILAEKKSLILHSCAVEYKGQGLLFMGESGSGKSTLARIWSKLKGAVVLSDERIVVRKIKDRFQIFGTPWTGSAVTFANEQAPLSCVYLIQHAKKNFIKPLMPYEALPVFLSNIRLPLWDKEKTVQVMEAADAILSSVPIFKLGFKPTQEVLNLVCTPRSGSILRKCI